MKINKKGLLGFFLLCMLPVNYLMAHYAPSAKQAQLVIKSQGVDLAKCSKNMLNCSVTVSQNAGCLASPGTISITNTSSLVANNIAASSTNPNFTNYIIQNNSCPAALAPGASCSISFYTNALVSFSLSNVAVQGTNTNATYFDMNAVLCQGVLNPSVSSLALSVNGSGALTGNSRQITLTNTAAQASVIGLTVTPPTWSATGTTYSTTCGSSLAASGNCSITVIPGSTATSNCGTGLTPTADVITVSASNASTVSLNILVLTYGCIYQGGYIYSVDDTTPNTGNIGGAVASTSDSSGGIYWDSSTACVSNPNNCYVTNANSGTNGTNTAGGNTFIIYDVLTTTNGENPATYAAGLCTGTISSYSDWYLPAICEMGYGENIAGINCGTSGSPAVQNMQSNLIDFTGTDIAGLTTGGNSGLYWSSSEYMLSSASHAWRQYFALAGSGGASALKIALYGSRCTRIFTP